MEKAVFIPVKSRKIPSTPAGETCSFRPGNFYPEKNAFRNGANRKSHARQFFLAGHYEENGREQEKQVDKCIPVNADSVFRFLNADLLVCPA